MKRLVYQPQVKVLIRLDDIDKTIDVSNDLVSGNLARNLNQISTFEFTLQNKFGKYIGGLRNNINDARSGVILQPMDRITVLMSRFGAPFQVFSGYLDEAPVFQLYPKTVDVRASCTLKLLDLVYFDPGLPSLTTLFQNMGGAGFSYDYQTGQITDSAQALGNFDIQSGLAEIIWNVLTQIGGWNPSNIHIKAIPPTFLAEITQIFNTVNNANNQDVINLKKRLSILYGSHDLTPDLLPTFTNNTNANNPDLTNTISNVTGNLKAVDVVNFLFQAGFRGDPLVTMTAIAYHESGWRTDAVNYQGGASGLWQILPLAKDTNASDVVIQDYPVRPECVSGGARTVHYTDIHGVQQTIIAKQDGFAGTYSNSVDGYPKAQSMSAALNPLTCAQMAYGLSKGGTDLSPWAGDLDWANDPTNTIHQQAQNAVNKFASDLQKSQDQSYMTDPTLTNSLPITTFQDLIPSTPPQLNNFIDTARSLVQIAQSQIGVSEDPSGSNSGPQVDKYLASVGQSPGQPWCAAFQYWCCDQAGLSKYVPRSGAVADWVTFARSKGYVVNNNPQVGDFAIYVNPKKSNPLEEYYHMGLVISLSNGAPIVLAGNDGDRVQTDLQIPEMYLRFPFSSAAIGSSDPTYAGTATTNSQGLSTQDLQQIKDSIPKSVQQDINTHGEIFQQVTPMDSGLAAFLTGERALYNTIALLQWIVDLVPSSNRVFCSHPNGDFYAFYPDRFGWYNYNTPYFKIEDVEILDFSVNVNDTNLATHVYGYGPITGGPTATTADYAFLQVASVLDDAFPFFIKVDEVDKSTNPGGIQLEDFTSRRFDPLAFLNKYGARPYKANFPNLRSTVLLWISTWMKFQELWSSRYETQPTFTFLPELMPGGRVIIADSVEMFVEQVTHTFDMTSGFTTTATFSSLSGLNGVPFGGDVVSLQERVQDANKYVGHQITGL